MIGVWLLVFNCIFLLWPRRDSLQCQEQLRKQDRFEITCTICIGCPSPVLESPHLACWMSPLAYTFSNDQLSIKFFRTLITILVFCIRCVGGGIKLKQAGQGLLRTGLRHHWATWFRKILRTLFRNWWWAWQLQVQNIFLTLPFVAVLDTNRPVENQRFRQNAANESRNNNSSAPETQKDPNNLWGLSQSNLCYNL